MSPRPSRGSKLLLVPLLMLLGVSAAPVGVSIEDLRYSPDSVTIKVGQSVMWTNNDERDHTVKATDGSFESPNLSPGQTFTHTFKTAGTFKYGCPYHPRERGTITVE